MGGILIDDVFIFPLSLIHNFDLRKDSQSPGDLMF